MFALTSASPASAAAAALSSGARAGTQQRRRGPRAVVADFTKKTRRHHHSRLLEKTSAAKNAVVSTQQLRANEREEGQTMGQRAAAALAALSLTASVGAGMPAPAMAAAKAPSAYVAELTPTRGNNVTGSFTFKTVLNKSNQEVVEITADVKGLSPGSHGINIHSEGGDLTCDDGACTGASFNPSQVPHGGPNSLKKFGASACHFVGEGCLLWRHIGDLGNVVADQAGAVSTTFRDPYISLKQGKDANVAGRSIVIRQGADDFVTAENDGNAGPVVAYGVLKPVV